MSNVEHRAKNISKIPLLDVTENKSEISFDDPRSPSAGVVRTPVDLCSYHLPNTSTTKNIPIESNR